MKPGETLNVKMLCDTSHLDLSPAQLRKLVERLHKKVGLLEAQIAILSKQRIPTDKHSANHTGRAAEVFVGELLNAKATVRNADHDLIVKGKRRLEVKGSACNTFNSGKNWYRRWTWHNFMGVGKQQKTFHRLILVGEAPEDLRNEYLDPSSPYVIFDLSLAFAQRIAAERSNDRGLFAFHVLARPGSAKSSASNRELWRYQVTRADLIARYGV